MDQGSVSSYDPAVGSWHQEQFIAAEALALRQSRRCDLVAIGRFLILVLLILALAAVAGQPGALPIIASACLVLLWLASGLVHGHLAQERDRCRRLAHYHQHGCQRCGDGPWPQPVQGVALAMQAAPDHPFAHDLDVVGEQGLLSRLDTCGTQAGRELLAQWFLDTGSEWPQSRQQVVRALCPFAAWRADLYVAAASRQLRGATLNTQTDFITWAAAAPAPVALGARVVAWVASVVMVAAIIAAGWWLGVAAAFAMALLTIAVASHRERWVLEASGLTAIDADAELNAVVALRDGLQQVTRLPLDAAAHPHLSELLTRAEAAASGLLTAQDILSSHARRANPLWTYGPGALLLSGVHLAARYRQWAQLHGREPQRWRQVLAEVEALSALATWAVEQPGTWAEIQPTGPLFSAENLAHPLLPASARVGNSQTLDDGQVLILTGANASGKSTWLRTIALSTLMARAGTTVTADRCQMRPVLLATVMRVHDDLAAGRSRFQAEVARLAEALKRVSEAALPPLLVFDEILGGTNSAERHAGTQAIIRSRLGQSGVMLVATHDLALAQLAEEFPQAVQLAYFADTADDQSSDLAFDYVLRSGVIQSTNALRVMRAAGLDIPAV